LVVEKEMQERGMYIAGDCKELRVARDCWDGRLCWNGAFFADTLEKETIDYGMDHLSTVAFKVQLECVPSWKRGSGHRVSGPSAKHDSVIMWKKAGGNVGKNRVKCGKIIGRNVEKEPGEMLKKNREKCGKRTGRNATYYTRWTLGCVLHPGMDQNGHFSEAGCLPLLRLQWSWLSVFLDQNASTP
jgi:hypothetical protein